ncbi:MAG: hypothetical protein AAF661_15180 [Pseudomonadota bacterium]
MPDGDSIHESRTVRVKLRWDQWGHLERLAQEGGHKGTGKVITAILEDVIRDDQEAGEG